MGYRRAPGASDVLIPVAVATLKGVTPLAVVATSADHETTRIVIGAETDDG